MAYIAFITNCFPSLSETFINSEVVNLRTRGVRIKTFSVRKPTYHSISPKSRSLYRTTTYLLPIKPARLIRSHISEFARGPARYFGCLLFLLTRKYDRALADRIKTFFHFAEGVYFTWLLRREQGAFHIHAHYAFHPSTISLVASRLTGIPFSFTAHADDIVVDGLLLQEKIRGAKFVMTCSNYGRRALLKFASTQESNKIHMVYHGVDVAKFATAHREHPNGIFTFLHVGRLSPEKAQDRIIEACALLRGNGLKFICLIVGDGPLFGDLKAMIEALNLQDYVNLVGRVFHEQVRSYYLCADAFVLSSIRDNLPNVLLESLAAGVPVIVPRIGAITELVYDGVNGIVVDGGGSKSLADAMRRIMAENETRVRMGREGQTLIRERFDSVKCIDQLIDVYAEYGVVYRRPLDRYLTEKNESEIGIVEHIR